MHLNCSEIRHHAMLAGIDPDNVSMMRGYLTGVRIAHDLSSEQWDALTASEAAKLCAEVQQRQRTYDQDDLLDLLTSGIGDLADDTGSNEAHIRDLEDLLGVAWAVMTPQQQQLVAESPIGRKALQRAAESD